MLRPILVVGIARSVVGFAVVSHHGTVQMASLTTSTECPLGTPTANADSPLGMPPPTLLNVINISKRSNDITATVSLDVSDSHSLTDESFIAIIEGSASLTSVNVSGCRELTDEAIKAVASRSLQSLNVAYCGKLLTDESIKAVATSCPSLTTLNAADCKLLTDESIQALSGGCRSLTSLDVSRCKSLTDESMKALAAGCTALTYLNVRNCEKLTGEAMKAVATLPELSSLRIFGCRKLSEESIATLAGCATLATLDTTNTFRQVFKASRRSVTASGPTSGATIPTEGAEPSVAPAAEEQPA